MTQAPELTTTDATTTVRSFLESLEREDFDAAVALLDYDIVWRNTSLPTVRGIDRTERMLRSMSRYKIDFAVEIHHIVGEGGVVLTERTDYLGFGRVKIGFWVCGTFEVQDGKITLWHDHFSWENFLRGTAVGLVRSLLPR
jgi:limonene-1,2-epoxide hydrolase